MGALCSKPALTVSVSLEPSKMEIDSGIALVQDIFVSRLSDNTSDHPLQTIKDRWMYLVANVYVDKIEFIYEDRFKYEILIQFPIVHAVLVNGVFLTADGQSNELRVFGRAKWQNRSIRVDATISAIEAHPHEVHCVLIGTMRGDVWKFFFAEEGGTSVVSLVQTFHSPVVKIEEISVSLLTGQTVKIDSLARAATTSPVVGRFPKERNFRFMKLYEDSETVKFLGRIDSRIKEAVAAGLILADGTSLHIAVVTVGGAVTRDIGNFQTPIFPHSENVTSIFLHERHLFIGGSRGSLQRGLCTVDQGTLLFTPLGTTLAMTQAIHEDSFITRIHYLNEFLVVLDHAGGFSVSSLSQDDSVVLLARTYIKFFVIVSDLYIYILSPSTLDKHLLDDMSFIDTLLSLNEPLQDTVIALHILETTDNTQHAIICTETQILVDNQCAVKFSSDLKPNQCEIFNITIGNGKSAEIRKFCGVMFQASHMATLHVYLLSKDNATLTLVLNTETSATYLLPEALLLVDINAHGGSVFPLLRTQEPDLEQQSLLQAEIVKEWIAQDAEAIATRVKPPPPLVEEFVGNAKQWIKSALEDSVSPNDDPAKKATKALLKPLKVGAKGLKLVSEGVLSKVTEATTQIIKNVETLAQIQDTAEQMENEAAEFARLAKQLESKF